MALVPSRSLHRIKSSRHLKSRPDHKTEAVPIMPTKSKQQYKQQHEQHVSLASRNPSITGGDSLTLSHILLSDTLSQPLETVQKDTYPGISDDCTISTPPRQMSQTGKDAPGVTTKAMAPSVHRLEAEDYNGRASPTPPRPASRVRSFTKTHSKHHSKYDSMRVSALQTEGIVSLSDEELSHLFDFVKEVDFGNWGSVWKCRPRPNRHRHPSDKLGLLSAASGGPGAPGLVAIKLVHRQESESTSQQVIAQRVRALWGEMRIIRSLRREPHPSIISFEAFVITPSYALVVMPYLAERFQAPLPADRAKPYFRQLASAVAYLHERGITHNDIKPANVVMAYPDVPVLIDFGFAIKYEAGDRSRFLSSSSWGTPEYLDPLRAVGQPHDERKSDVWSLGITMYEILVGRTPFEAYEEEEFHTAEKLTEYYQRARAGIWLGHWEVPPDLEELLRWMIYPDPRLRATAVDVYHHPSLARAYDTFQETPSVIRQAVNGQYEDAEFSFRSDRAALHDLIDARQSREESREFVQLQVEHERRHRLKTVKSDIGQRKERRATAHALGESVRQATSVSHLRPAKKTFVARLIGEDQENSLESEKRYSPMLPERDSFVNKRRPRIPATLVSQETTSEARVQDANKQPRVSEAQHKSLRPASLNNIPTKSLRRTSTVISRVTSLQSNMLPKQPHPKSRISTSPTSSPTPAARREALLRTMQSLEGERRTLKGSSSPSKLGPKRPKSLDLARELDRRIAPARSVHLENVSEVEEMLVSPASGRAHHLHAPPQLDVSISTSTVFSNSIADRSWSGKYLLRTADYDRSELELISRYRGDLPTRHAHHDAAVSPARRAKQSTAPEAITFTQPDSLEDLDRLANWAKSVERYVEDTRRAIAEGRQPPSMPAAPASMRGLNGLSPPVTPTVPFMPSSAGQSSATLIDSWKAPTLSKRQTVSQVFKRFVTHDKGAQPSMSQDVHQTIQQPGPSLQNRFNTLSRRAQPSPIPQEEFLSDYDSIRTRAATPTPNFHRMGKPSSMVSLREKARSLLPRDSQTMPRGRPETPGAGVIGAKPEKERERKSIFQLFGLRRKT